MGKQYSDYASSVVKANNHEVSLKSDSTREQLMAYFKSVCRIMDENHDEFPVNLDDVWPLTYGRKSDAVEALTKEFIQDVDYQVLRQNPQNPLGGRPTNAYYLSLPCFEFFIARKKREVFEVYRQFFHKARRGEMALPQNPQLQYVQTQLYLADAAGEQTQVTSKMQSLGIVIMPFAC